MLPCEGRNLNFFKQTSACKIQNEHLSSYRAPSSLPDKQKVLYKKKLVKVKKLLKKNFSYVVPQTAQELDLPKLLKTVKEFDFVTCLSKLLKKLGVSFYILGLFPLVYILGDEHCSVDFSFETIICFMLYL